MEYTVLSSAISLGAGGHAMRGDIVSDERFAQSGVNPRELVAMGAIGANWVEEDLAAMTRAELADVGAGLGLTLNPKRMSIADMIAAIEEARAVQAAPVVPVVEAEAVPAADDGGDQAPVVDEVPREADADAEQDPAVSDQADAPVEAGEASVEAEAEPEPEVAADNYHAESEPASDPAADEQPQE